LLDVSLIFQSPLTNGQAGNFELVQACKRGPHSNNPTTPHRPQEEEMENSTTAASNQPGDQHQDKLRVRDLYKELGEAGLQAISQEFYDRVYGA
jgi:hypothetical protein